MTTKNLSQKFSKKQLSLLIGKTETPVVIFDLDGTLFDVSHRTIAILKMFSKQKEIRKKFKPELTLLSKIRSDDFLYSLESNLNRLGISRHSERGAEFIHLAEGIWFKNFFTDKFVLKDKPYEKAVETVQWFYKQGCKIVYLSGRDVPNMSRGTLNAMEKAGFPIKGPKISVILKPDYGSDDLVFKRHSTELITKSGTIVATFDNEPANVDMFLKRFPKAYHFHFLSAYSKHLELKGRHFYKLKKFQDFTNS